MSSIAVTGSATGIGVISLLAPVTNTNRTINLPDSNGTIVTSATAGVPINGPAFSVYATANTAMSPGVFTKVPYNTEVFDTNSCFDSTTNYRFTPTVAGYYQFNSSNYVYSAGATSVRALALYKNGTRYQTGAMFVSTPPADTTLLYSGVVYLNGSTDYIEVYVSDNGTTPIIYGAGGTHTVWLSGAMVRSAV